MKLGQQNYVNGGKSVDFFPSNFSAARNLPRPVGLGKFLAALKFSGKKVNFIFHHLNNHTCKECELVHVLVDS